MERDHPSLCPKTDQCLNEDKVAQSADRSCPGLAQAGEVQAPPPSRAVAELTKSKKAALCVRSHPQVHEACTAHAGWRCARGRSRYDVSAISVPSRAEMHRMPLGAAGPQQHHTARKHIFSCDSRRAGPPCSFRAPARVRQVQLSARDVGSVPTPDSSSKNQALLPPTGSRNATRSVRVFKTLDRRERPRAARTAH